MQLIFLLCAGLILFFSMLFALRTSTGASLFIVSPLVDWALGTFSGIPLAILSLRFRKVLRGWHRTGYLILLADLIQIGSLAGELNFVSVAWSSEVIANAALFVLIWSCLRYSEQIFSESVQTMSGRLVTLFLSLVIPLQTGAIASTFTPNGPNAEFESQLYKSAGTLLSSFYLGTTGLFLLLTTAWVWYPIAMRRFPSLRGFSFGNLVQQEARLKRGTWALVLVMSAIVGAIISSSQWLHGYPLFGDSQYYVSVLQAMEVKGVSYAFSFDRPLFFLFLYGVEKVLGINSTLLLRLMLPTLAVALVGLTFYFVRVLTGRVEVASVAAFLAAVSPHVTVGSAALLVANWSALCLLLLLSCAFLKCTGKWKIAWISSEVVLFVALLWVHFVTWLLACASLVGFVLLGIAEKQKRNHLQLEVIATLALTGVSSFFLISLYSTWVQDQTTLVIELLSQVPAGNFINFFSSQYIVYHYFGIGHVATPVIYLLGFLGYASVAGQRSEQYRWLKSWFIVSCIGFFLSPYAEWWRFLYFIPLEILAALGLYELLCLANRHFSSDYSKKSSYISIIVVIGILAGFVPVFSTVPLAIVLIPLAVAVLTLWFHPSSLGPRSATLMFVVSILLQETARAIFVLT